MTAYKSVTIQCFSNPGDMYARNYASLSEFESLVQLVEECQKGIKECRVQIRSGARDGTILRISNLMFAWSRTNTNPAIRGVHVTSSPYPKAENYLRSVRGVGGFAFALDDGTDVTDKYSKHELFYKMDVLLDCSEPTIQNYVTKPKPEKPVRKNYVDRFGIECPPGTFVAFGQRNQDTQGVAADMNFGKIISYMGQQGVLLRDLDGKEVQLNKLAKNTIVAMDKDIMKRLMLTKLSNPG